MSDLLCIENLRAGYGQAVVLRDLYRAGYDGARFTQSYALTEKSLGELPKEVTQGVITVQPSADVNSPAYAAAAKRLGIAAPDSYEAQATDWISLVVLTIAKSSRPPRRSCTPGGRPL